MIPVMVVGCARTRVDEPLEQLHPTFDVDGQHQRAIVEAETVTVTDFNFMGRVETVNVQGVAANTYLGMSVTEPSEQLFRVVERRGRLCAPLGGAPRQVSLAISHPYWEVASHDYHLIFAWKLTPPLTASIAR